MQKLILLASAGILMLAPYNVFSAETPPITPTTTMHMDTSDEAIRSAVNKAFANDEDLAPFAAVINVEVKDGVVTLTGSVSSNDIKVDFENIAEDTSGVKDVDNKIEVQE